MASYEYHEYLRSIHWKNLRRQIYRRDPVCRWCGWRRTRNIHHGYITSWNEDRKLVTFYRNNLYETRTDELVGLCRKCHMEHHGIGRNWLVEILKWVWKVIKLNERSRTLRPALRRATQVRGNAEVVYER